MKRENKFRGKRIDNGKLIYGQFLTNKLGSWILEDMNPHYCRQYGYIEIDQPIQVIPKTVGEYIGLKDKNGNEIYEGDILETHREASWHDPITDDQDGFDQDLTGQVVITATKGATLRNPKYFCNLTADEGVLSQYYRFSAYRSHIIGNIHENPELLK